jgi:hypothetical protein
MAKRRGLSLLELILALGLSGLILYAVAMAIDLHLRSLDVRRTNVEEAQIARAVLYMIANDIRSTVRRHEVDMSAIEQMAQSALGEAAEALGGAGSSSGGDGDSGGEGGTGTGGSGAGGSGTGGSGTGGSAGDTLEQSAYTGELASTTELPPVPGLYGNQYQLQLDVSRLPRPDQYQVISQPNDFSLPNIPSDIKTVTYFVQAAAAGNQGVTDPFRGLRNSPLDASSGLVRREVDRSVMEYALTNGTLNSLASTGDLLAPEVTSIQFQYFDGYAWWPEWDSEQMQGLPVAVEIAIVVTPRNAASNARTTINANATAAEGIVYRLLVHLPLGEPLTDESSEDSGLENLGL